MLCVISCRLWLRPRRSAALLAAAFALTPARQAVAASPYDQQASLRLISGFSENPNDVALYPNNSEADEAMLLRESFIYRPSRNFRIEANAYAMIEGASAKNSPTSYILNGTDETNRSAKLEHHWHNSAALDGYLTVDRLNLKGNIAGTEVTAGRFPINLSVTAIFTPNDFFAPFRPYDYYREYKPGVDAVRFDHALGSRGQISVMGVAGYENHLSLLGHSAVTATSGDYSPAAASAVARVSQPVFGFDAALLGGKLGAFNMLGFSLQGELGPFGLRAEGHQRNSRVDSEHHSEAVVGLDYRPWPKLLLQLEQYFNGAGYPNTSYYANIATDPNPPTPFIARNYTGLGAVYELTSLLSLKTLLIANEDDQSLLTDFNLVYSTGENSELVISLLSPRGRGPSASSARSEFGSYPNIVSVQTGIYF